MNIVMVIARNLLEYFNSLNTYDIIFIGANILLMMLLVTFIYVLKFKDKKVEVTNTIVVDNSDISLEALTSKLQESTAVIRNDLTKFENEEETKAIISYDELINTQSIPVLKYKNEEEINGLLVRAIDVNNLIETMDPKPISHPAVYNANKEKKYAAISKVKEEELLLSLKKLNSMLEK